MLATLISYCISAQVINFNLLVGFHIGSGYVIEFRSYFFLGGRRKCGYASYLGSHSKQVKYTNIFWLAYSFNFKFDLSFDC